MCKNAVQIFDHVEGGPKIDFNMISKYLAILVDLDIAFIWALRARKWEPEGPETVSEGLLTMAPRRRGS